jgi:hypothetical protein
MAVVEERSRSATDSRRTEPAIDVVVVSYNSRDELRPAVSDLADAPGIHVVVVDNASQDGSLDTIADLPVERIALHENRGFSVGCNAGWRAGRAPYVLFLNPDARIDETSLRALVDVLEGERRVGLVGPRIVAADGALDASQRRFHRVRTTFASALFLHRILRGAAWVEDIVRDPAAYRSGGACDWVSGACMLVRRDVLEAIGGFDERFFLYCEDEDLCKRIWNEGHEVRFEPLATCVHAGGASAPRPSLFSVSSRSWLLYAQKHSSSTTFALEWAGLLLYGLTHAAFSRDGARSRIGHLKSVMSLLRPAGRGRPSVT